MAEKLRQAIRDSGISANQLGKLTDVKQQTISAFLLGASISLVNAQRLADHFRLVLVEEAAAKNSHNKKPKGSKEM